MPQGAQSKEGGALDPIVFVVSPELVPYCDLVCPTPATLGPLAQGRNAFMYQPWPDGAVLRSAARSRGRTRWEDTTERVLRPKVLVLLVHGRYRPGVSAQEACGLELLDNTPAIKLAETERTRELRLPAVSPSQDPCVIDLSRTALVIAGACSSGRVDGRHLPEGVGISTSLLRAGVRCVISAPWPVWQDALHGPVLKRLWCTLFERLSAGEVPARALARARESARQSCNPADECFAAWGSLAVYGDGFSPLPT